MFSNQIKELIENELFNTNYGRILILKKFEEIISKCDFNTNLKVCVIGGSVKEPEILLLRKLGFIIGNNSYIGFLAILDCENITIGDNVYISGFNLIHRIQNFVVKTLIELNFVF